MTEGWKNPTQHQQDDPVRRAFASLSGYTTTIASVIDDIIGSAVTDHGALTGLADNDHPQYVLVADHTKAAHDALNIDADTLDGLDSTAFALDADLDAHLADTSDAHDASAISYAGGTGMAATDVEAGLDELATEKLDKTGGNVGASAAILTGGSDTTVADGTGILQVGASGAANIGIDNNEITARNGAGAASPLYLNFGSGPVYFPDGDSTAPGISFGNDTNTGFSRLDFFGQFMRANVNGVLRQQWAQSAPTKFQNGTEATLADDTGELQVGANTAANLGLDGNEIQARSGGAAAALNLNPHGGDIAVGGGKVTGIADGSAATDASTKGQLDAHVADTSDAHDASAISYVGGPNLSATDVEAALDELGLERVYHNASTASVSGAYASDTYLAGSSIVIPTAGGWKQKTLYRCTFDMQKTAAGTATFIITVRLGTLGTTGDTAINTLTFDAGSAAADLGQFEVDVVFRSVGSGSSAVTYAVARLNHALAGTGLSSLGSGGYNHELSTSAGFDSTTQTTIGLSVNGGASFSGTNTLVRAELIGL
jgi:hypothetical protein